MKEYLSKYKWQIFIFSLMFIFLIPLAINVAFKQKAPCSFWVAEWGAGDALSFYGTLLASVATIIGVYISIQYAQKSYRDDVRNQVLPFFAVTQLRKKSRYDPFLAGFDDKENSEEKECSSGDLPLYEEYKPSEVYIVIDTEGIQYKVELNENQRQILEQGGLDWHNDGTGRCFLQAGIYVSMPFEAVNIGNGGAINTQISFHKEKGPRNAVPLFTIKQNEKFYFHIFSDNTNFVVNQKYVIELKYGDILGNYYTQKYPITFGIDSNDGRFYQSIDLAGTQHLVNDNKGQGE